MARRAGGGIGARPPPRRTRSAVFHVPRCPRRPGPRARSRHPGSAAAERNDAMAANLIDMVQSALGPTLAPEASRYLGESETSTRAAIGAALPALMAGLVQEGTTPSGAARLFASVTAPDVDSGLAGNLAGWLSTGGTRVGGVLAQGQS